MTEKRISSIKESCKTLPHKNDPKHARHLSDKLYKKILNLFFKKIVYYMIKEGAKFVIPQFLGTLQITRYNYDKSAKRYKNGETKRGRIMVDFHATKKLKEKGINKTVKHTCRTTGGYWWKLHWFKAHYARFRTQRLYQVKFTRPNVRPNTYNKENPKLSVVPYFKDKGWTIYAEIASKR